MSLWFFFIFIVTLLGLSFYLFTSTSCFHKIISSHSWLSSYLSLRKSNIFLKFPLSAEIDVPKPFILLYLLNTIFFCKLFSPYWFSSYLFSNKGPDSVFFQSTRQLEFPLYTVRLNCFLSCAHKGQIYVFVYHFITGLKIVMYRLFYGTIVLFPAFFPAVLIPACASPSPRFRMMYSAYVK